MKIAVFSTQEFERDFLKTNPQIKESVPELDFQFLSERLRTSTVDLAEGADAACIFVNDEADASTIRQLADIGVKSLLLRCAGFNNVDLEAAAEHQIVVQRVPAYSPNAVAEFAVALLLTVARKTHKAYNRTRDFNFALRGLRGFDIHGKTIGIIGTGKIGRIFAAVMNGFGARTIAYDIRPSDAGRKVGIEYVSLDELFSQSDIISLHCPMLPSTRHMINADAISKMKKGVMLLNTSRGELVDMDALIDGIRKKIIGSCGMDVLEDEQDLFFEDHSGEILHNDRISTLLSFPNVLITPHIAFCTDTALTNIWETTIHNFVEFNKSGNSSNKFSNQLLPEDGN